MPGTLEADFASVLLLAWKRQLSFTQLLEHASRLEAAKLSALAAVLYQTWLQRSQTPHDHFACFNLGVALFGEGDLAGARQAYEKAIQLAPGFIQPRFNLGLVFERLGQPDAAVEEWRWIEQHASREDPEQKALLITALNNLGRLHEVRKQYLDAQRCLEKSLSFDPNQPDALHHWVYLRAKQCAWPVYAPLDGVSPALMRQSTSALAMIGLSDDPAAQLTAARHYATRKVASNLPALAPPGGYTHDRIRIAYCSSDFCLHPVAMLTAELFEVHDRTRVEVYGFCWTREDGSALRRRIIGAMDHVVRIDELDDAAAARLIRSHEIDILIDLQGQTSGARAGLLAHRPAPIQITYLGLPATTGLPCIDHVIADRFLIPEEATQYFSEKPIYMPDVYQVSDRQRKSAAAPSLESCGLPSEAFVYCCFNNNYKYTPEVFGAWMNILRAVPGSVLWLLSDNQWAEANLGREAQALGIDPGRLVFAGRVSPENYLARYGVADVFLDSFPFNAGTTANDALWMGLPVLTMSGRSFASRMAGALLTAAGLDELITYNLGDYEARAIDLARAPAERARLRERLARVRENGVLFDTPRFARALEDHFTRLVADLPARAPVKHSPLPPAAPRAWAGKTFLHVGCGPQRKNATTPAFNTDEWTELRLDINEAVGPDIVGTMTDMSRVPDASVDAIFSSHNVEHLYPHEVPVAFAEFSRVLRPDGFAVITCPDLKSVCALVAEDGLTDPAYQSAAGPIAPLDILYGHRPAMAAGNLYMSHHCGFTEKVMRGSLAASGFLTVTTMARPESFDLWALASKSPRSEEAMRALAAGHFARVRPMATPQ